MCVTKLVFSTWNNFSRPRRAIVVRYRDGNFDLHKLQDGANGRSVKLERGARGRSRNGGQNGGLHGR